MVYGAPGGACFSGTFMSDGAAVSSWPPPGVKLAARIFPERLDDPGSSLDEWASAALLFLARVGPVHARAGRKFLRDAAEARAAAASLDERDLVAGARRGAAAAFQLRDAEACAKTLGMIAEAARRRLGLHPYPPQLLGAWELLRGRLVQLDTGEGKTLTAAMAACVAGLAGVATHVVTVNDYLAQRDAQEMGPLFECFGLSVGVVHSGVAQESRASEYARSVTYCTNKDLVFDYLRDRVASKGLRSHAQLAVRSLHGERGTTELLRLRGLHFAIVDEADSVLIDEARTPLILSSKRDAGVQRDIYGELLDVAAALEHGHDYALTSAMHSPELTAAGVARLEEIAADRVAEGDVWRTPWVREHYIVQALRALHVYRRDQHYAVTEGKVVIIDEFTGRLLPDRTWEQGLHQMIEAKEGCAISGHNVTLARITYQTFFGRYLRLAGMSGTLSEVATEMASVYRAGTVSIDPNRPCRRIELPVLLLRDQAEKAAAVVEEVSQTRQQGRPVLVGTRSVRASQEISIALAAAGIAHRVLNALQNADEAELIAVAGQPHAVTVATNMAGRGTDIRLHPSVVELGGLHVVLTEWHESARIDRQLFGRCARQGDPGTCRSIVALDDELIQRYGGHGAGWLARRYPGGRPPAWAITLLRRLVQGAAETTNARQRRLTMRQDRSIQAQLAFSGGRE